MKPILQLGEDGPSPFRILSSSANPENPSFSDVLFDANAQMMRVKQKGVIYVDTNPGFWDGPGCYAGRSVPIVNPHPTRRHIVLANGWLANETSAKRMLPCQYGQTSEHLYTTYFAQNGIGVATDATSVWGINCNSGKYNNYYNYYLSSYCYVSYLVLHNTIG